MKRDFLQPGREYAPRQRLLMLLLAAPVFLLLLPWGMLAAGFRLDALLGWQGFASAAAAAVGGLLALAGWLFALWTVWLQFRVGRGTPIPLMATQELIVQPPYAWTRNPMALGTLAYYSGLAVAFGSLGVVLVSLLLAAALLIYIKQVEEKEMLARFGDPYRAYQRQTPFLFPRFRR